MNFKTGTIDQVKNGIALDGAVAHADLLLCCSHTVLNGLLSHYVASQLITEPTVGMVVFLYCTPHHYKVKLGFTFFLFLL